MMTKLEFCIKIIEENITCLKLLAVADCVNCPYNSSTNSSYHCKFLDVLSKVSNKIAYSSEDWVIAAKAEVNTLDSKLELI